MDNVYESVKTHWCFCVKELVHSIIAFGQLLAAISRYIVWTIWCFNNSIDKGISMETKHEIYIVTKKTNIPTLYPNLHEQSCVWIL